MNRRAIGNIGIIFIQAETIMSMKFIPKTKKVVPIKKKYNGQQFLAALEGMEGSCWY